MKMKRKDGNDGHHAQSIIDTHGLLVLHSDTAPLSRYTNKPYIVAEAPQYNSYNVCVYYARYTQVASHKLCTGCVMNIFLVIKGDLGTGDLCDNIGLVGVSAKWSYIMSLHHMTQPSLSCFLCMLAIPIFPFLKVEEFLIYLLY